MHGTDWRRVLAAQLPHRPPTSNNHLTPLEKALAFTHGLLGAARKLAQVAYLRRDPLLPELLGVRRVASASVLSRFFGGFTSAGRNLACFRAWWRWCVQRLPSRKDGYTLDLDSTRLLHEDGHQEGVRAGYTRVGVKPCLHPLLAVLHEARLVAGFWLRSGNATCGNNVSAFFPDLWHHLPAHVRLRAGAGRQRILPAGTAPFVGATAAALHRGGTVVRADQNAAAGGPDLDDRVLPRLCSIKKHAH